MNQRVRRRKRRRSKARERRALLLSGLFIAVALAVFLIVYFVTRGAVNRVAHNVIWDNIYIEGVNVSGMKAEEAKEALDAQIAEYQAETVKLVAEGEQIDVTLGELGFQTENLDVLIKKAVSYGKDGSVWSRYSKMKSLQEEAKNFELTYLIDSEATVAVISQKMPELENAAKDATIKREGGRFVITDSQTGKKIDLEASVEVIESHLNKEWESQSTATIELVTVLDEPDVTREQLEQIQDVLGTFRTFFGTGTSNREKNIINATSRINGAVLLPGEELSASEAMGENTEANGYLPAGSYLNGQVVQSLGGGVCQVSTTLYNAVLLSELEITQRYAHSMLVDYVKPSMDAAIAEGYKDLKFKNNTDAPIYIEGYISGGNVVFTIYGKESRAANRKVSYVSDVLSSKEAEKKFVTSDEALGTLKLTIAGHTGMQAKLWKIVTENGSEVRREVVNSSSYTASAATWSVGIATDNAEAQKIVTDAIATQNETKINEAIAQAKALIEATQTPETPTTSTTPDEGTTTD